MKKINFILLSLLFMINNVFAQDNLYSQKLIHRFENLKKNSEKKTRKSNFSQLTCVSPLLKEMKKNWNRLNAQGKEYFLPISDRPVLTGELIFSSTHFDIHYTLTSIDSLVHQVDNNSNSTPDFIERISEIGEYVYDENFSVRNYTLIPIDSGIGGSDRFDIYIFNIDLVESGLYGYVEPDGFYYGDNPNSLSLTEVSASSSFMGLSNDYSWAGDSAEIDYLMMALIAHEFFHAVQMGYTTDNTVFIDESTADWMQSEIYPGNDNNFEDMEYVLCQPDVALNWGYWDEDINADYEGNWYGQWLFFQYIAEQNSSDIIRKIYERCIDTDELEAIDNEMVDQGYESFEYLEDYFIAKAIMDSSSLNEPFTFYNAAAYNYYFNSNSWWLCDGLKYESTLNLVNDSVLFKSNISGNKRLMRLSADYFHLKSNKNFTVKLTPENPIAEMDIILVKDIGNKIFEVQYSTKIGIDYVINVNDYSSTAKYSLVVERFDPDASDSMIEHYIIRADKLTSIADPFSESTFIKIYPNPANEYFIVENTSDATEWKIEVKNLLGENIFNMTSQNNQHSLPVPINGWTNGMYFISIKTNSGNKITKKIIINK